MTDYLKDLLAGKTRLASYVGQVQSVTSTGFVVVLQGQPFPAYAGSGYMPAVAEQVRVWFVDEIAYVMGPAAPNPGQGTVVSVTGGQVTLNVPNGTLIAPYSSTLTPNPGDVMQIVWGNGPFAIATLSAAPASAASPGTNSAAPRAHTDVFQATDSGSYQSRWWTNDVWASDSNLGAWFYGSKLADTLPAAAVIQSVQLFVSVQQLQGAAPNFALHGYQAKPSGAPALTSATAVGVGGGGWVTLPVGFGNALRSGGGAAGVGVAHGGDSIFNGQGSDGQSGALRIISTY